MAAVRSTASRRHCEERSDEAIHGGATPQALVDCRARCRGLAMTGPELRGRGYISDDQPL